MEKIKMCPESKREGWAGARGLELRLLWLLIEVEEAALKKLTATWHYLHAKLCPTLLAILIGKNVAPPSCQSLD